MKTALLFLGVMLSVGCQHLQRNPSAQRFDSAVATSETGESWRETKRRSLHDATEARTKIYEQQGYSKAEARAIAEAEYFRAGKK